MSDENLVLTGFNDLLWSLSEKSCCCTALNVQSNFGVWNKCRVSLIICVLPLKSFIAGKNIFLPLVQVSLFFF